MYTMSLAAPMDNHSRHSATDSLTPDPLELLFSFPLPPTHIPSPSPLGTPSPMSSYFMLPPRAPVSGLPGPPPSPAPLTPLPPLPKTPSIVSERDTLAFISSARLSVSSRSHRLSRSSTQMSSSSRSSIASSLGEIREGANRPLVSVRESSPDLPRESRQSSSSPEDGRGIRHVVESGDGRMGRGHGRHRESLVDIDLNDLRDRALSPVNELQTEPSVDSRYGSLSAQSFQSSSTAGKTETITVANGGHGHDRENSASSTIKRLSATSSRLRPSLLSIKSKFTRSRSDSASASSPRSPSDEGHAIPPSLYRSRQVSSPMPSPSTSTPIPVPFSGPDSPTLLPPQSPPPSSSSAFFGMDEETPRRSIAQSRMKALPAVPPAPLRPPPPPPPPPTASQTSSPPSSPPSHPPTSAEPRTRSPPSPSRAPSPDIATIIRNTSSRSSSSASAAQRRRRACSSTSLRSRKSTGSAVGSVSGSAIGTGTGWVGSGSRKSSASLTSRMSGFSAEMIHDGPANTSFPGAMGTSGSRKREASVYSLTRVNGTRSADPSIASMGLSTTNRTSSTSRRRPRAKSPSSHYGYDDAGDLSMVSDYGELVGRQDGGYDLRVGEELEDAYDGIKEEYQHLLGGDKEEEEEDGEGSDSASSIDLHTPLPHLLLRAGVLSPHSKILNQGVSDSPAFGRPSSIVSTQTTTSFMTKSGLFKDERNTEKRRIRHRDGHVLRDGRGLTTGLGWSDSEDEDAPSAFTNRLSQLALKKKASQSSIRTPNGKRPSDSGSRKRLASTPSLRTVSQPQNRISSFSHPHPLSKSLSSSDLLHSPPLPSSNTSRYLPERPAEDKAESMKSVINYSYPLSPELKATRVFPSKTRDRQSSDASKNSGSSIGTQATKLSNSSSAGSTFSLKVTIPKDDAKKAILPMTTESFEDEPPENFIAKGGRTPTEPPSSAVSSYFPPSSVGVNFGANASVLSLRTALMIPPPTGMGNLSPTPSVTTGTSSSRTSLHSVPMTPVDPTFDVTEDEREDADDRFRTMRAKTPTAATVRKPQPARSRTLSGGTSELPKSNIGSTPRPLRLPALAFSNQSTTTVQSSAQKLQPGQPAPRSGLLLGYNRNLHDQQRMQAVGNFQSVPGGSSPLPSPSPLPSTPSTPSYTRPPSQASRIARPSLPNLASAATSAVPSSFRYPAASALASTLGTKSESGGDKAKTRQLPRTGTGMVYRKSSSSLTSAAARAMTATGLSRERNNIHPATAF